MASLQAAREKMPTLVAEARANDNKKAEQEALAEKEAMVKRAAQSAQTLALVPAGSFSMGDSFGEGESDERPVRQVTVSAFYMGKTEVTKKQWDAVRAWGLEHGYTDLSAGEGKAANAGELVRADDHLTIDALELVAALAADAKDFDLLAVPLQRVAGDLDRVA